MIDSAHRVARALPKAAAPAVEDWAALYARRLLATDTVVVVLSVFASHLLWFGLATRRLQLEGAPQPVEASYWLVSFVLVLGWLAVLTIYDTRDPRVIGIGTLEYKRLFDASLTLFGVIAIAAAAQPACAIIIGIEDLSGDELQS